MPLLAKVIRCARAGHGGVRAHYVDQGYHTEVTWGVTVLRLVWGVVVTRGGAKVPLGAITLAHSQQK